MNVLILHNRYRQPGGEERSVAQIADLLRRRGHAVELLERSSAGLGRAAAGRALLRGGTDPQAVAGAVARSGATVVHVHNPTPLFGDRALRAARAAGARVVMHLHNYRLVCSVAITYRDDRRCTQCHGRNTLPGIVHRCRGGIGESLAYGVAIALRQRRALAAVDRFAVPSAAAADQLAELGLDTARMSVIPNFLGDADFADRSRAGDGEYALYAGRLTAEKGVAPAIEACARARVPLVVAGDGPDSERLHALAAGSDARFAGHVDAAELARLRKRAAFALVPSRWDEPCPYAVIEAMAAGLPVLASDVGGLGEMVGADHVLPADALERWSQAIAALWSDAGRRGRDGQAALERAHELFGEQLFYERLLRLYGLEDG